MANFVPFRLGGVVDLKSHAAMKALAATIDKAVVASAAEIMKREAGFLVALACEKQSMGFSSDGR